jgi:glycosyltransferase involved in cell wall biosynthesis
MGSTRYGHLLVVAGDPVNAKTTRNADIHKKMPLYLDVGDLAVLPLRDTLLAQSQMPIKIFEALAMGKPVIGTAVADLPIILDKCGIVVPPNDAEALAQAIEKALFNEVLARDMSNHAREKCIREFSVVVCGARLRGIVEKLL